MKVLLLHNRYQFAGGEDAVFEAEKALLETAGCEVLTEVVSNDGIRSLVDKIRTGIQATANTAARRRVDRLVRDQRPDIVHVHNFFPLLSPAIYDPCNESRIPVIQTLHNFRTICAGAMLIRAGAPCEKCVGNSPFWGAVHRCYRRSFFASAATAHMISAHQRRRTWHNKVDRFIALTEFARGKFIDGGLPDDKIVVKPNFVQDPQVHLDIAPDQRRGALYVGRVSPEKGLATLIEAWKQLPDIPLTVVGDGPSLSALQMVAPTNVRFVGWIRPKGVLAEMSRAAALIMPSLSYEGFPMALGEAYACGLPVIGSRLGSLQELIQDGITGFHARAGDANDLARILGHAFQKKEMLADFSLNARQHYEENYTPDRNLRLLLQIYLDALEQSGQAPGT